MKKCFFVFFIFLQYSTVLSQNSRLTINLKQAPDFCQSVKSSVLIIPLINNSESEINSLKAAVRKYWKVSTYKFINKEEYDRMRDMDKSGNNTMYLLKETYERLSYRRKDWAYTKYFITSEPGGVEVLDAPYVEFKLPVKSEGGQVKEMDYSFIYGLMIKQMNYDLELMCKYEEYRSIKRKDLISARFDRDLKDLRNMDLLISMSDLENYRMNLPDDKKNEKQKNKLNRFLIKKTGVDAGHIKFVKEEDIKKAVSNGDTTVLIYTGFTIYTASDGRMLRRIDPNRGKRRAKTVLTVFVTALIITGSLMFFRSS